LEVSGLQVAASLTVELLSHRSVPVGNDFLFFLLFLVIGVFVGTLPLFVLLLEMFGSLARFADHLALLLVPLLNIVVIAEVVLEVADRHLRDRVQCFMTLPVD